METSSVQEDFLSQVKEGNYSEVSDYLQNYSIDMEIVDSDGLTALVIAASEGYFSIVKLLVENGANIFAGNSVSE